MLIHRNTFNRNVILSIFNSKHMSDEIASFFVLKIGQPSRVFGVHIYELLRVWCVESRALKSNIYRYNKAINKTTG